MTELRELEISQFELLARERGVEIGEELQSGEEFLRLAAFSGDTLDGLLLATLLQPVSAPVLKVEQSAWCLVFLHVVGEDMGVARLLLNGTIRRLRERKASYLWLDVPQSELGFFLERQFEILGQVPQVSDGEILRIGFDFGGRARLLNELLDSE